MGKIYFGCRDPLSIHFPSISNTLIILTVNYVQQYTHSNFTLFWFTRSWKSIGNSFWWSSWWICFPETYSSIVCIIFYSYAFIFHCCFSQIQLQEMDKSITLEHSTPKSISDTVCYILRNVFHKELPEDDKAILDKVSETEVCNPCFWYNW